MQCKSYNTIIILLLVITLVTLSACSNESQDLFIEKTDTAAITDTTTQSPVVTSSSSDKMNVDEHNSDNTQTMGDSMEVKGRDQSKEFYYEELSDTIKKRINGKSYKDNCDVPYEDLRYVNVLYWGFDEQTHKGELIVNKDIAQDIVEIFSELYDIKYPIERMVLVDDYDADDNTSMAADNTSSFNYRNVDGTEHLSLHSYGLAIDINPLYNPYVRTINNKTSVLPEEGTEYADRNKACSYYITEKDDCYRIFTEHGFTWGGDWKKTKDYQHFEKKL